MALASSGCVIAGPPDYQDPSQTPPVLDLSQASPTIWKVLPVNSGAISGEPATQIPISVPERSEDAGDEVWGLLYLDYNGADNAGPPMGFTRIPPSTFDDTGRVIALPWSALGLSKGCHTLTLLVTHGSNVQSTPKGTVVSIPKDRPDDVAFATWWVDVDDDATDPTHLSSCPKPTP